MGDDVHVAIVLNCLGKVSLELHHVTEATTGFEESHRLADRNWARRSIAYSLEGFACLAIEESRPARAGQLSGAARSTRIAIGANLTRAEKDMYYKYENKARAALGETAFLAAFHKGHAMTRRWAIAYALEESGQQVGQAADRIHLDDNVRRITVSGPLLRTNDVFRTNASTPFPLVRV